MKPPASLNGGALPIDNTADERINRPFTIGRNNWGQAGSEMEQGGWQYYTP